MDFTQNHTVIPICPELLGGLGCPRDSVEQVDGIFMTKNGKDVTKDLKKQITNDYKGLNSLSFGGTKECGTQYCTKEVKDITKNVFNDCMTEFRNCLQLKYSQYNDRERQYNSRSWGTR